MSTNDDESTDSKGNARNLINESHESDNYEDSENELGESEGSEGSTQEDSTQDEQEEDEDFVPSPPKARRSTRLIGITAPNYDESIPVRVKKKLGQPEQNEKAQLVFQGIMNSQEYLDNPEAVLNYIKTVADSSTVATESTAHATTSLPDPRYATIKEPFEDEYSHSEEASIMSTRVSNPAPFSPLTTKHELTTYGPARPFDPTLFSPLATKPEVLVPPAPIRPSARAKVLKATSSVSTTSGKLDLSELYTAIKTSSTDRIVSLIEPKATKVEKKRYSHSVTSGITSSTTVTGTTAKLALKSKEEKEKEDMSAAIRRLKACILANETTPISTLMEKVKSICLQIVNLNIDQLDNKKKESDQTLCNNATDKLANMYRLTHPIGEGVIKDVVELGVDLKALSDEYYKSKEFEMNLRVSLVKKKSKLEQTEPRTKEMFEMQLKQLKRQEHAEQTEQFSIITDAVMTTPDTLDRDEQLAEIEAEKLRQIDTALNKIEFEYTAIYIKECDEFAIKSKKIISLNELISTTDQTILAKEKSVEYLLAVTSIIECIRNRLITKLEIHSSLSERLNYTAKVCGRDIITPLTERDLTGIIHNIRRYFKGADVASWFSKLMVLFELRHPTAAAGLFHLDDWFKMNNPNGEWDRYTTENVFKGIMVIIGISDPNEKKAVAKYCQKYFNSMEKSAISNASDMALFVDTNGTLVDHIRQYIANKESIEKMDYTADKPDTHKKGNNKELPQDLLETLSTMSQSKLSQLLSQVGKGGDNTKSSNNTNTNKGHSNNNRRMSENQVIAHLASAPLVVDDKTLFPIARTGMTYPLFATIKNANLKRDVVPADKIYTRAKDQTHCYESYKDKSSLIMPHFTNASQCSRCKGYGHYSQRCLQETA